MSKKKPVVTPAVAPVAPVQEPVAAALAAAADKLNVDPAVLAATAAVEQKPADVEGAVAGEPVDPNGEGDDEGSDQGGEGQDESGDGAVDLEAAALLQQAGEGEAADQAALLQVEAGEGEAADQAALLQVEAAAETISVSMGFMQQELGEYVKVMRPGYPVPAEQGVQNQMRLFRCIEGILRQEGAEFFQQLNYLLAVFKENRDGAFSERYLFRFWDNLALSQRDRTLFERLLNLFVITADHTSRADAVKHVDLNKTVQLITSGPAQERMFQFYAM